MYQYVCMGSYELVEIFGHQYRNYVVLVLPYIDGKGQRIREEILTFLEKELREVMDVTTTIDKMNIIPFLVNAFALYMNSTRYTPNNNTRVREITRITTEYLDNLLISQSGTLEPSFVLQLYREAFKQVGPKLLPKCSLDYDIRSIQMANNMFFSKKARIIQDAWKRAYYDPNYKICRTRLMREYNELLNETRLIYY